MRFETKKKILFSVLLLALLLATPAFADGKSETIAMSMLGGAVQLILGVFLAIVSISIGIKIILPKILPEVRIVEQLKNANRAVALMTAGVVIAYTQVISSGIGQMGDAVSLNPSFAAFGGGMVNVIVGLALGSIGVTWAFKALKKVTPEFALDEELKKDNVGVGVFLFGVLYAVSSMIATGVEGIGKPLGQAFVQLF